MTLPRGLLLVGNGMPSWRRLVVDTVREEFRLGPDGLVGRALKPTPWHERFFAPPYEKLSYVLDWLEAFQSSPSLELETCNILNVAHLTRCALRIRSYDVIVVLHSAMGDAPDYLSRLTAALQRRRGQLLVFVGNEYDRLDEKIAFIRSVDAEVVATQLPIAAAEWLYSSCSTSRVVALPAALNPARYAPAEPPRDIDLGFRGQRYPLQLGDDERNAFLDALPERAFAHGLSCDIGFVPVSREEWAALLQRTRCVPGAEAGTRWLDPTGATWRAANAFVAAHPQATLEELRRTALTALPSGPSGKAISSRHFEAIGAGCCQLLIRGDYNGILIADEHYLPVCADLRDLDDALEQLGDAESCRQMASRARQHVLAAHTYAHRVRDALSALGVD